MSIPRRFISFHFILIFLYGISFAFNLLNPGIFWDDWFIVNQPQTVLHQVGYEMGSPVHSLLYSFFPSIPYGTLWVRFTVFVCFLLSAFLIERVLRPISWIDTQTRWFIVILSAIFPVNSARFLMCVVQYSICFLLFWSAFWLTGQVLKRPTVLLRFLSLGLFFISFFTGSFLFFYIFVLAYIVYFSKKPGSIQSWIQFGLRWIDYIALPILFAILKFTFWKSSGEFSNYNQITLSNIIATPARLLNSFYEAGTYILNHSFNSVGVLYAVLLAWVLVLCIHWIKSIPDSRVHFQSIKKGLWLGVLLFIFGILPYLLANKPAYFWGWATRNQLLLGVGNAFLWVFLLQAFSQWFRLSFRMYVFLFSLICIFCVGENVRTAWKLHIEWVKNLAIIEEMTISPIFRSNHTLLIQDNAKEYSMFPNGYGYAFTEFTGMMHQVFGNETRLAVDEYWGKSFWDTNIIKQHSKYIPHAMYKIRGWTPNLPEYRVIISSNHQLTHPSKLYNQFLYPIKLYWLQSKDPGKYHQRIREFLSFKYEKLSS